MRASSFLVRSAKRYPSPAMPKVTKMLEACDRPAMLRTILSRFFFAGLILAALSAPARAANGATGGADGVALLRLVAAETGHAGQPFLAGIEMRLADGWKTYWRRPGDSGIAPRFDWSK